VLVHVVPEGVQLVGLNEPVTPVGRPLTVKLTGCPAAVPTRVAVITLVTLLPCATVLFASI